jgi:hypothetical protein
LVILLAIGVAASSGTAHDAVSCPPGTAEWRRGIDVTFCAYVCSSDADCDQGIERCHLLDPEAGPADPPIFIDDNPEIVDVFAAEGKPTEGLCDPFFDVEGVVGAEAMPVLEETAELVGFSEEVAGAPLVEVAPPPPPKAAAKKTTQKAAVVELESDGEGEGP